MHVLGRETDRCGERGGSASDGREEGDGPRRDGTLRLGSFLARDGSTGAGVGLDADGPHAGVVVGKRGTGKSYTLGVIAEGLAEVPGVAPVVIDPMGVFAGLEAAGGRVVDPVVRPSSIPPSVWPELVGLDPTGSAGSLLWRVVADVVDASESDDHAVDGSGSDDPDGPSIETFRDAISEADASADACRAAANHLSLAASWGVFDAAAPPVTALLDDGGPMVVDLAGVPERASAAVVRTVARGLYDARIADAVDRLPWLLIDEAHAFFGGVSDPALRTLLTRGRAPGVSLVCATQRPGVLPPVAISQSDLLVAHRLTAERDVERLADAEATYLAGDLASQLPTGTGEALVVDDATEEAHTLRVRERRTPHGGGSPSASETAAARTADGTERVGPDRRRSEHPNTSP